MRVAFSFLANYAELTSDGKFNIQGGDFSSVSASKFPFAVPFFYVVCKMYFDPADAGQRFPFRLRLLDPEGNPLDTPQMDNEFLVPAANDQTLFLSSGLLVLVQNCEFRQPGNYRLIVQFGEDPVIELPLRVQEVPAQPI